jgi:hypothetical protein
VTTTIVVHFTGDADHTVVEVEITDDQAAALEAQLYAETFGPEEE